MRWRSGLLLAMLLAPGALAASSLDARLTFDDDPTLEGALELATTRGFLDLSRAPPGAWILHWNEAKGYHAGYEGHETPTGGFLVTSRSNDTLTFGPGSLRIDEAMADATALAELAGQGRALVTGDAQGALSAFLARVGEERTLGAPGLEASLDLGVDRGWIEARANEARPPALEGNARLVLWGVTARAEDATGEARLETGERAGPDATRVGGARSLTRSHVVLALEGARVEAAGPIDASLIAPTLDARLSGTLAAERASGWLSYGGRRVELRDDALLVRGVIAAEARALLAGTPLADATLDAQLSGEADEVRVGGARLGAANGTRTALVAGGAAAALVAGLWLALRAGLLPFYSRLQRDAVMENVNRLRLYERVCARPGESAVAIARAVDIDRVVAQYHLRVLEQNGFVAGRGNGRLRLFFAADAAPRPEVAPLHAALRDPTRRRIADRVANAEGITQKEIVESTARSQRLVAYHLQRLEELGLVEGTEGRPRIFRATPALVLLLATGEEPIAPGAPA